MAKITVRPAVDLVFRFSIDEQEARALDALAGYGDDSFITAFYEKLGKSYMEDHEAGLRSFLKSIRDIIPPALLQLESARKAFDSNK